MTSVWFSTPPALAGGARRYQSGSLGGMYD
jgi:hypothetical protein